MVKRRKKKVHTHHLDADFGIRVQIKRRHENIDLFLIPYCAVAFAQEPRTPLGMCIFHAPADGFFLTHLSLHLHTIANMHKNMHSAALLGVYAGYIL